MERLINSTITFYLIYIYFFNNDNKSALRGQVSTFLEVINDFKIQVDKTLFFFLWMSMSRTNF